MFRSMFILMTVGISLNAFGSDHWDDCSNATGSLKIENGQLSVEGTVLAQFKVLSSKALERKKEYCILKNHKTRVLAYSNETTIEKVQYKYMDVVQTGFVVCERGGSGIPANDECRD